MESQKPQSLERPGPLYDEQGKVNDPEIAEEMALHEERMRNDQEGTELGASVFAGDKTVQEYINSRTGETGKTLQKEKEHEYRESDLNKEQEQEFAGLLKKIVESLSEKEKIILRRKLQDPQSSLGSDFKKLLF